jgi:hypothetical protein
MVFLKNRKILPLTFFFVVIVCLIRLFQGVDFTDTGFLLSHYKYSINNLNYINLEDYTLLGTFLIGGFFYNFFGFKTLVSFKILYFVASLITLISSYVFLKKFLQNDKRDLLFYLLISFFFLNFFHQNYLDYDNISIIFLILILNLTSNIYQKENYIISSIFLTFLIIFSVFINFKNLSYFFNLLLILSFLVYEKKFDKKYLFLNLILLFIGSILSLSLIWKILHITNITENYFDFLNNIFLNNITDSSDVHSFGYLLKRHLRDYSIAILFFIVFVFFHKIFLKQIKNKNLIVISSIFFLLLSLVEIFIIDFKRWYLPGIFAYIIFLCILEKKEYQFFYILIFINIFLISAGSAGSVEKTSYIYWLTIPITFAYFLDLKNKSYLNIFKFSKKYYFIILLNYFLIFSFSGNLLNTYRDSFNFLKLSHPIDIKELKYSFTNRERANSINTLYNYLNINYHKNEEIINFNSIPMIYFITDLKPYRKIWNFTSSVSSLEKFFLKNDFINFPDLLYAKVDTMNKNWPTKGRIEDIKTEMNDKKILIMYEFIEKYNYKIKWQNDAFVLMSKEY